MAKHTLRQILAENIRRYRKRTEVSQEDFALQCGCHRTYVGSVERCERNVTLETLELFAKHQYGLISEVTNAELISKRDTDHFKLRLPVAGWSRYDGSPIEHATADCVLPIAAVLQHLLGLVEKSFPNLPRILAR